MAWFRKTKKPKAVRMDRPRSTVPEGLWVRCEGCKEIVYSRDLDRNLKVCPKCGYHFRIDARTRLSLLLDDPQPRELFAGISPVDPLNFRDSKRYRDRLKSYQQAVGERDAVIVAQGTIEENPVVVAAMEYRFMGGSMGSVVGEKIARAAERACERKWPFVVVSASGGARMQEGVLSLMQMAKTSAALARFGDAKGLFISVLTDPTTGGVTASYAMLGDVIFAEPKALIGFAGPRVIQQTIRQELPEGFQRSEYLKTSGMVDRVVHRAQLRSEIARVIDYAGK